MSMKMRKDRNWEAVAVVKYGCPGIQWGSPGCDIGYLGLGGLGKAITIF